MMGEQVHREVEDADEFIGRLKAAVEYLYIIRDTFFPFNPHEKLSALHRESDIALKILDSIPPEQRSSPTQRASYEYMRGKILDVFPDYTKAAEDHLSKAVKLNPSLADAWLCLGNSIWKKGDLPSAKNCLLLALKKGPNKNILCQLSMLERRMAQDIEYPAEIVKESIQHAKQAISLDVKHGNSWYNLGNAYLTYFFVTGAWDHKQLLQSLKAYQNAEKDETMKSNPDLYFNCATVNKYLENYERSLHGFEAAASRDPGLNANEEVKRIVSLLSNLDSAVKGWAKTKKLMSSASSMAHIHLNPPYLSTTIDVLKEGMNKTAAVTGKVLLSIKHDNSTPLYYLMCDSNCICYVLSVYGMHSDAIKEQDEVSILDPCFRKVDLHWKEEGYEFKSIRVDLIEQVRVNGKALSRQQASTHASILAQHKP